MTKRALSFGSVARAYEVFRPGYPDELVDEVLSYAGRPVRTALEIGAGTGKATRVFAGRGIAVTATDPDPAMLAELRQHVPGTVRVVRAAFEDLPLAPEYDLVFAAASLHWTEPEHRWTRVAGMLRPGGVFSSFGGPAEVDDDVAQAVRVASAEFLASDDLPSPDGTPSASPIQWPGSELLRSDLFGDVRQSVTERRFVVPASDYVGQLATISAYLELPEPSRVQVLDRILAVLPEQVTIRADITLHLARLDAAVFRPVRR